MDEASPDIRTGARMTARDITGTESRILSTILAHPQGIARSKIMAEAKVSKTYFNVVAMRLMAEGRIGRTGSGPSTVWGPLGIEKRVPRKKRAESYRRDQRRRAQARRAEAAEKRLIETIDDPLPVTRMIVPAATAPRIQTSAPASVWALA